MKTTSKLLALCAVASLSTFAVGSAIADQTTNSKTEVKAEEAATKTVKLKVTGMK